jgi:hypothetical protein
MNVDIVSVQSDTDEYNSDYEQLSENSSVEDELPLNNNHFLSVNERPNNNIYSMPIDTELKGIKC